MLVLFDQEYVAILASAGCLQANATLRGLSKPVFKIISLPEQVFTITDVVSHVYEKWLLIY